MATGDNTMETEENAEDKQADHPTILDFSMPLKLVKCTVQECGCNFSVHCPFCDKDHFKPGTSTKVRDHLEFRHFAYAVQFGDKSIVKCFVECDSKPSGHYHCPVCKTMILKRVAFVKHLKSHARSMGKAEGYVVALDSKLPEKFSVEGHEIHKCDCVDVEGKHFHCPLCDYTVNDRSVMVSHIWRCKDNVGNRPSLPRFNIQKDEEFNSNSEILHPKEATTDVRYWHQSIVRNMKDLPIQKCTLDNCCDGKLHCPLCTKDKFKPTFHSHLLGHFVAHWKKRIPYKGYSILICTQTCELLYGRNEHIRYHYHCPICGETRRRRPNFIHHLKICQGERHLTHRYSIQQMEKEASEFKDIICTTNMDECNSVDKDDGTAEHLDTPSHSQDSMPNLDDSVSHVPDTVNIDEHMPIEDTENVTVSIDEVTSTTVNADLDDVFQSVTAVFNWRFLQKISLEETTIKKILHDISEKTDLIVSSSPGTLSPVYTVSGQPESIVQVKKLLEKMVNVEREEDSGPEVQKGSFDKAFVDNEEDQHDQLDNKSNFESFKDKSEEEENSLRSKSVSEIIQPKRGRGRPRKVKSDESQEKRNVIIVNKDTDKEEHCHNLHNQKNKHKYFEPEVELNTRLSRRYLNRKTRVDFSALVKGKRKFKNVANERVSDKNSGNNNVSVKNFVGKLEISSNNCSKDINMKMFSTKETQAELSEDDSESDEEKLSSVNNQSPKSALKSRTAIAHVPHVLIENSGHKNILISKFNLKRKKYLPSILQTNLKLQNSNYSEKENSTDVENYSENQCKLCDFRGDNFLSLTNHYKELHKDYDIIRCDVCERFFDRQSGLTRHLLTVHGPREASQGIVCTVCNKTFHSEKSLSLHSTSSHGIRKVKENIKCHICSFECRSSTDFKNHIERVHNDKPVCEICGKKFARQQHLYTHMQAVHYKSKKAVCDLCGKKFGHVRYLKAHMKRHLGIKNHVCKLCGFSCTESNTLRMHMETHLAPEERNYKYVCSFCGKKYLSKSNYRDHLNKHTGDKPYKCDVCDKRFGFKSMIDKHKMFVHSTDKPFKCSNCPKAFKLKRLLSQHMVTHTGQSRHICEGCKRPFSCKNTLKTHTSKCKGINWSNKVNNQTRTVLLFTDNTGYNISSEAGVVLDSLISLENVTKSEALEVNSQIEKSISVEPEIVMANENVVMATENGILSGENIVMGTENIVIDGENASLESSDVAVFLCSECNAVFDNLAMAEQHVLMSHTETAEDLIPHISGDESVENGQSANMVQVTTVENGSN